MIDPDEHPSMWRLLQTQQAGIGTRLAATLITGLVFAAGGITAGWGFGVRNGRGYVPDLYVIAGLIGAGLVWAVTLAWIWRGQTRGVRLGRALLGTCVTWMLAVSGSLAVDELLRRVDEEYLICAILLLAGAVTIYLWWDVVQRARTKRPVVDRENIVNVTCPACGYRLNGLHDLRCPECGKVFTIDELIRAQNYAGSTVRGRVPFDGGR